MVPLKWSEPRLNPPDSLMAPAAATVEVLSARSKNNVSMVENFLFICLLIFSEPFETN
jgi:hypothetical protein